MLPLPKGAVWQAFLVLCLVLLVKDAHAEVRVVCYYTNWSVYRPGTAKFNPQNINPYLCTHLIYAFGGFTKDNTLKPFDKYQDIEQGGYAKFTGLKSYNKQLKTLLAIGGWNEASSRFSPLVASPERRQQFIRNILKFLRQNHFDGLDLDWEYPAFRDGGKPRDRDNYAQFVEELRSEFDRESDKTGRPRLLLTMAVPAGVEYIEKGYDIPKLNRYLDWFNILSYDYHSAFEPSINHHAPLYSLEEPSEYNYDIELNIDYTVKFYLEAGAERNKLVLGIPTYGRSYTLIDEESTEIGSPADGPGEQGDATREKGYLAYYEICQNIKEDSSWTVVQPNEKAMGPYAYRGNQWVGYDDEAIAAKKGQYVAENGLGGIMFWSIDNDDFRGTCTGKPYPLIEAAKEALLDALGPGANEVAAPSRPKKPARTRSRAGSSTNRNRVTDESASSKSSSSSTKDNSSSNRKSNRKRPSTTKAPRTTSTTTEGSLYIGGRTTTPAPPTTPDPGADFKCEEEGFFAHPRDCKKYFWCLDSGPSNLGIVAHQFTCPAGLYFNTAADSCDFTRNVLCKKTNKDATTTKATPAATITTTTTTTTTKSAPLRITAATSSYSYIQRTTTARPADDDEDEEEYEDEEPEIVHERSHEEDPKVIKELIELIKRVGGLDELEKQIQLQEDGTVVMKNPKTDQVSTTPSSISQSLYAKVLHRPNTLNTIRNRLGASKLTTRKEQIPSAAEEGSSSRPSYNSINRNSRPSPQNAGIDKLPEFEGFLKEKPKYVTINRPRPTKSSDEQDEYDDDETSDEESDAVIGEDAEETSKATPRKTSSSYVNISRSRPTKSTLVEDDAAKPEDDEEIIKQSDSKSKYQSINRIREAAIESASENTQEDQGNLLKPKSTYQTLTRTRTSTESTIDTESNDTTTNTQIKSRLGYQSVSRNRTTTLVTEEQEEVKEEDNETSKQERIRPTYQSFTRSRNSTQTKNENEEETVERGKQTYQSASRFRPTTSASPAEDEANEEEVKTKSTTRTRPTGFSFQQSNKARGTTVAPAEVETEVVLDEVQKKNRYSLFTRRQSTTATNSESDAEVAPTQSSSVRARETTVSSTGFVEGEANLKSVGSTNRYQVYDRRSTIVPQTAAVDEAQATSSTKDEDAIPSVTVQSSESRLPHTTPITPIQEQDTPSVTPENTYTEQRSTETPILPSAAEFTASTLSPQNLSPEPAIQDLQQPSVETSTHLSFLHESSSVSPNHPDTSTLKTEIETNSAPSVEPLLSSFSLTNDNFPKDSLTVVSTASNLGGLDTESSLSSKTSLSSTIQSGQDNTDQVTVTNTSDGIIEISGGKVVQSEGQVGDLELTKSNSKTESSPSNVNSKTRLSNNVDNSDSVVTLRRTTSTTTQRPSSSPPASRSTSRFSSRRRPTTSTTTEQPDKFVSLLSSPRPFSLPSRRRTRPSQLRTTPSTDSSLDNNEVSPRTRSTAATKVSPLSSSSSSLNVSNVASKQFSRTTSFNRKPSFNRSPDLVESNSTLVDNTFNVGKVTSEAVIGVSPNVNTFDRTSSTINSYVSPRIQQTQAKQGLNVLVQDQTQVENSPGTTSRSTSSSWQTRSRGTFRPWRTTSSSTPSPFYLDRPYRPDYDTSVPSTQNSPQNSQGIGLNGFGGQYWGDTSISSPTDAATGEVANKRERRPVFQTHTTPSTSTRTSAVTSRRYVLDTTTSADNSHDRKVFVQNQALARSLDLREDAIEIIQTSEKIPHNEESSSPDETFHSDDRVNLSSRISFGDDHADEVTAGSVSTLAFSQNNFGTVGLKASTSSDSFLNFEKSKSSTKLSGTNLNAQNFTPPKASFTVNSNVNKYLRKQSTASLLERTPSSTDSSNEFRPPNRDATQLPNARSFKNPVYNDKQAIPTTQRAITRNRGHVKQTTTTESPHLTTETLYRPHRPEYLSDLSSLLSVDLAKWSATHNENKLRKMVLRRRPMLKPSLDDETSQDDDEANYGDDNVGSFSSLTRTMVLENGEIGPLSLTRQNHRSPNDSIEHKKELRTSQLVEEITYSKEAKDKKFRYVLREMKNRNGDGLSRKEKELGKTTQVQLASPEKERLTTVSPNFRNRNEKIHGKETRLKSISEGILVNDTGNLRTSNKKDDGQTNQALQKVVPFATDTSKLDTPLSRMKQTVGIATKSDHISVEHDSDHISTEINALLEVRKEQLNDSDFIDIKSKKPQNRMQDGANRSSSENVEVKLTHEEEPLSYFDTVSTSNDNTFYVKENSAVESLKAATVEELGGDDLKEKNQKDEAITTDPSVNSAAQDVTADHLLNDKTSSDLRDQPFLKRNYHVDIVYYTVEDPTEIDFDSMKAAKTSQSSDKLPSTLPTTLADVSELSEDANKKALHTIHRSYESSLSTENALRKTDVFSNNLVEASSTAERLSATHQSSEEQSESSRQTKLPLIHLTTSHVPFIPLDFNETADSHQGSHSLIHVTQGSESSSANAEAIEQNRDNATKQITTDQSSEFKHKEGDGELSKYKTTRDLETNQSFFGRNDNPEKAQLSGASQASASTNSYPDIPPDYVDDNYEAILAEDTSSTSLATNSFADFQQVVHEKSEGQHAVLSDASRNYIDSKNIYSSRIAGSASHPTKSLNPQSASLPAQPHGHISSTISSPLDSYDDELPIYYRRNHKQFNLNTIQYQDSPIIYISPIIDSETVGSGHAFTASTSSQILRGGFTSSKPINSKNIFSTTPRTTHIELTSRDIFNAHTLTTLPVVADVIGATAPEKDIIASLDMPLNEHTRSVHLLVNQTTPTSQFSSKEAHLQLTTNPIIHPELNTDDENERVTNTHNVGSNNSSLSLGHRQSVDSASSGASTILANTNNVILQPNRIPTTDVTSSKRNHRGEHLEIDNLVVDSTSLESTAVPNEDGRPMIDHHLLNGSDSALSYQDQSLFDDSLFSNEIIGEDQTVSPLSELISESAETNSNVSQSEETVTAATIPQNTLFSSSEEVKEQQTSFAPTEHPTFVTTFGQTLDLKVNPTESSSSVISSLNLSTLTEEVTDSQLVAGSSTPNTVDSYESILGPQEPSSSQEVRNIIKGLLQLKDLVVERITSLAYDATTEPTSFEQSSAEQSSIEQFSQEQASQEVEPIMPRKAYESAFSIENNSLKGRVVKSTYSEEANPWDQTSQQVESNEDISHELETTTSLNFVNDENVDTTPQWNAKETTISNEEPTTEASQVQDTVIWQQAYGDAPTVALPQQNTYAKQVTVNEESTEKFNYTVQVEGNADSSYRETTTEYQAPYLVESGPLLAVKSEIEPEQVAVNIESTEKSYSTIEVINDPSPELTTAGYKPSHMLESNSLLLVDTETTTSQPAFEESGTEEATIPPINSLESSHERSSSPLEILSIEKNNTSGQTTPPVSADLSASYDGEQLSSEDITFMFNKSTDEKLGLSIVDSNEQMAIMTTPNIGLIKDNFGQMSTLLPIVEDTSQETSTEPSPVQEIPSTTNYSELQIESTTPLFEEQQKDESVTLPNTESSEQIFLETVSGSTVSPEVDSSVGTTESSIENTMATTERFADSSVEVKVRSFDVVDDSQSSLPNDHEETTTVEISQDTSSVGTLSPLNEPLSTIAPLNDQKETQENSLNLSEINLIHSPDYSEESYSPDSAGEILSQTTTSLPETSTLGTTATSTTTMKPSRGRFRYNSKEIIDGSSEIEAEKPIYIRPRLTLEPPIKLGMHTSYRTTTESITPTNTLLSTMSTENPDFVGLLGRVLYQETTTTNAWPQTQDSSTATTSFLNNAIESGQETSTQSPDEDTTIFSRTFSSWTLDDTTTYWNGSDTLEFSNSTSSGEMNSTLLKQVTSNFEYPEAAQTQLTEATFTQTTDSLYHSLPTVEMTTQSADENDSLNLDTSSLQSFINDVDTTTVNTFLVEETTSVVIDKPVESQESQISNEAATTTINPIQEEDLNGSQEIVSRNENKFSTMYPQQIEETLGVTNLPVDTYVTTQPKLMFTENSKGLRQELVDLALTAVNDEDYSHTTESTPSTSIDMSVPTAESYPSTTDVPSTAETVTLSPETERAEVLEIITTQFITTTISAAEIPSVTILGSGSDENQSQPIASVAETTPDSQVNNSENGYGSTIENLTTTYTSASESVTEPLSTVQELPTSAETITENYIPVSTERTSPVEETTLSSLASDTTVRTDESLILTSVLRTPETPPAIEIPPAKPTISSETTLADLEVLNYFEQKYSQVSHISNRTSSKQLFETDNEIALGHETRGEQEVQSVVAPSTISLRVPMKMKPSIKAIATTASFEEVSSSSTLSPARSRAPVTMMPPVSTLSTTTIHHYETELTPVPTTTTTRILDTTTSPAATTSPSPTTTSTTAATSSSASTTTTSKPLETSESNNIEPESSTQTTTEATTNTRTTPVKQRVVSPYNRLSTLSGRRSRPYTPNSRTRVVQTTSEKPATSEGTSEPTKPTAASYRNRLSRYRGRSRTTTESTTVNSTPSTYVKTINSRVRPTTDHPRYTATIRPRVSLSTLFRQRANFRYRTSTASTTTTATEAPNYPGPFILTTTSNPSVPIEEENLEEVISMKKPSFEAQPTPENVIVSTGSETPLTSLSSAAPDVSVAVSLDVSVTSESPIAAENSVLPEASAVPISPIVPILSGNPESASSSESSKLVETENLKQTQDTFTKSVSSTEPAITTEFSSTTSVASSPKTLIGRQRLALRRPVSNRSFQLSSSTTAVPEITTRKTYVRKRIFLKKVETPKLTVDKINEYNKEPSTEPPPFVPSSPRNRLRIPTRNNAVTLKQQVATTEKMELSPEPKDEVPAVTREEPRKDEGKRNRSRRPGRRNRQRSKNRENKEQNAVIPEESPSDNEADPNSNRKTDRGNSRTKGDSSNRRQGRGRSRNRAKSSPKLDSDNAIIDPQEPLPVKNEKRVTSRTNIQSRNSGFRSKPSQTETILNSSETADEDFFRKDEQSSSEQNTNKRTILKRIRSRANSNEEVPISNSNAPNEDNENNAITKLRPVSKNEEKVFEKKPGLQRRKALRLRQKQNFRLLASKGGQIRDSAPHANPSLLSLDKMEELASLMEAGSSNQFVTANLYETQTLPTYDADLNYAEQLSTHSNNSQKQDFFREHLRNITLDTANFFIQDSSIASTDFMTSLTSYATTEEAYPSSAITTVPLTTTTESTAVLSSSNHGLDSLVSKEYFSHQDFVPQERLIVLLDERPKANIITTPNEKAEGTTEFGMRNVTGIFSSEGYITRVQRIDVMESGVDNSFQSDSTDSAAKAKARENEKQLRNNLALRRNRVEASSKKDTKPLSNILNHDLDMSGSDSFEDIANIEGSTVRSSLIFLKGPTPNPNVLLASNSRTYQRNKYSKVQSTDPTASVDKLDLSDSDTNQEVDGSTSSITTLPTTTKQSEEDSTEDFSEYQPDEDEDDDYDFLSRLLSSMKRIFSGGENDEILENTTKNYVTIKRMRVISQIPPEQDNETAIETGNLELDTEPKSNSQETTTKSYVMIKRIKTDSGTEDENIETTTIGASALKDDSAVSNEPPTSPESLEDPNAETLSSDESEDISEEVTGALIETVTKREKNYVSLVRPKSAFSFNDDSLSNNTPVNISSTVSKEKYDSSAKLFTEEIIDTTDMPEPAPTRSYTTIKRMQTSAAFSSDGGSLSNNAPEHISSTVSKEQYDSSSKLFTEEIIESTGIPDPAPTRSYTTIKRVQTSTTIPINQIEDELNTTTSKEFEDDEIVTSTPKYITLMRTRTPKALSDELEANIEISTPGREFASAGLFTSTTSSTIDSTAAIDDQEEQIILSIVAANTNAKDTNEIKNIFSPRRVYTATNRAKPSPTTGSLEPFENSEENLPEKNEFSPDIGDIVATTTTPPSTRRPISFRTIIKPFAISTSPANFIGGSEELSPLTSTSRSTTRKAFTFRSRTYPRPTRPTLETEDHKSNDYEEGEDELHPSTRRSENQNINIERTTEKPRDPIRLQGSPRRTFAVRRRVRVSSTTLKNEVSSDISVTETSTKANFRRNYASLTRTRAPTTEAVQSSAENFESDEITSTTRKPFGLTNRRPPAVKTTTSKPLDYPEDPEGDFDEIIGTTTKRTYGILNRQKFPNQPKISDDVNQTQDIVSPTKRTYSLFSRGGQLNLPSAPNFSQAETSSTTNIQTSLPISPSSSGTTKVIDRGSGSPLPKFKFPTRARPVLSSRPSPIIQELGGETDNLDLSSEQPTINSLIKFQPTEDPDESIEEEEATNSKQTSSPAPEPENSLRPSSTTTAHLAEHPLFNLDLPTPTPATNSDTQSLTVTTNTNNLTYFSVNGPDSNALVAKQLVGVAYIDDNYGSNNTQPVVDVSVAEHNVNVDFSRPLLLNLNRRFQNSTSRRGAPSQVNSATRSTSRYSSTAASASTESPNDARNQTSGAASGRRRVAVFRVRRPQTEANVDNNSGSVRRRPIGEQRDNSRDFDVTTTKQTLTVTTEDLPSARRNATRRRLVRKRPVSSSTTPQPISTDDNSQPADGHSIDQEPRRTYSPTTRTRKTTTPRTTEVTEEIIRTSIAAPVDSVPTKRFRKVIRRLKKPVLNETTTVVPVLKAIPQDDGRIHLLKVGEQVRNETVEEDIISKVISDVKESVRSFGLAKETNETEQIRENAVKNTTQSMETKPIDDVSNLGSIDGGASTTTSTSTTTFASPITEITAYEEVNPKIIAGDQTTETTPGSQDRTTFIAVSLNDTQRDHNDDGTTSIDNSTFITSLEVFENTTDNPISLDSSDLLSNGTTPATDTTSTIATTKSKLYASRRPYKPTKPSILAITSTESSSSTPKSYVRKFSTNFTSIKPPGEIDNPVAIIVPKAPAIPKQTTSKYRPKQTTSRTTPTNDEDENEDEEGYEEDDDESDPEGPRKVALIKPNYVLINRTPKAETHLIENPEQDLEDLPEDETDEEPYNEEEKIRQLSKPIVNYPRPTLPLIPTQSNSPLLTLGIPFSPPIVNQPTNPLDLLQMVILPTQQPTLSLNAAPESGSIVRLNNGFVGVLQKSESKEEEADVEVTTPTTTTRRKPAHRITRPTNKPRVVNRPFVTTIHPASLQLGSTPPKPTTPAPFRSNGTRNYERKYSAPSSTESTNPDNSLLEDLNIDALNARNKKIFEQTSRKHTTMKPKTTQKELNATGYTNDTDSASYYTTQLQDTDINDGIVDANGFTQFQEGNPASPAPHTSTTSKITTLHHIFELSKEDDTTTERFNPHDHVHTVMTSNPRKLVEINRIVEVYSRENVFKINVNSHATRNVSSSELKLESLPRVDHIGEISRNSLVNLFDSVYARNEGHGRSLSSQDGGIVIEGRSAVSGFTNPEGPATTEFTPVRNSIPQYQTDRDGKSERQQFVPDVLSGVETSTISLEGLFESSRKSKSGRVINSPVYATSLGEVSRSLTIVEQTTLSPVLATTESYKPANGVVIESFSIVRSTTPAPVTTTLTPRAETQTSTPSATVETKTEQSSTKNPNYIRPLVPLLRPESNEAAPLVISIANLDQVTLSKVPRDSNAATSGRVSTFVRPDGTNTFTTGEGFTNTDSESTLQEHYKTNEPIVHTQTSYSSEIHIVKKRVPRNHSKRDAQRAQQSRSVESEAMKIRSQLRPSNVRRPILSVRRRITPVTNSTTDLQTAEDPTTVPHVEAGSPTTIAPVDLPSANNSGVTTETSFGFTNRFNRNRIRPTLKPTSPSETVSSPAPRVVVRRKFARPIGIGKRLPSSTTTLTPPPASPSAADIEEDTAVTSSDDETRIGDTTRPPNPLFRRRFSSTTPTIRVTSPSTLDAELVSDPEIDQEAGQSVQDTKFANHRFNQIGENLDDDENRKLVEAFNAMSKAPPPIGKEEAITRRIGLLRTTLSTSSTSTVPIATTRRTIIRRPQKTTFATTPTPLTTPAVVVRRRPHKPEPFEKVNSRQFAGRTYRPILDYDYYDDDDVRFVSKSNSQVKVVLHGRGIIECLDQGNFPHPLSCKKFISCAKMETGGVVGWEYTCPKGLSYDPVGGICNWASGLGCKD